MVSAIVRLSEFFDLSPNQKQNSLTHSYTKLTETTELKFIHYLTYLLEPEMTQMGRS